MRYSLKLDRVRTDDTFMKQGFIILQCVPRLSVHASVHFSGFSYQEVNITQLLVKESQHATTPNNQLAWWAPTSYMPHRAAAMEVTVHEWH